MEQYIPKAAVVAEVNALQEATMDKNRNFLSSYDEGKFDALTMLESFIDTLEVKEVSEHNDVDMNSIFEEIGVDPDSHIASLFKNAFYKAIDRYLEKGRNAL